MTNQMLLLIIIFLPTTVMLAFMPYLTRKTENFGVTIPETIYERKDFKSMRKKYALITLLIGIIFVLLFFIIGLTMKPTATTIVFSIIIVTYIIANFLIYLPFHFKMKKIKQAENWQAERTSTFVVDMKFRQEKLIYSNWLFLIPGFLTLFTIGITFLFFDKIPEKIPMHTDFAGNVRFDDKSIGNLLMLPGVQIFMVALFIFINFIIKHSKQQVSIENPETSKQRNILYRRRWSLYIIITSILMTLLFAFAQLTFIFPVLLPYTDIVSISIIVIILIGTFVLSALTGQGGSRIKLKNELDDTVVDQDNDQFWKLGQFYFNKNDPSIFIEKRFGIGWTNNWAHPISWIFLIVIIGLAIGIPLLLSRL